jgi:hypothetical protein
MCGRSFIPAIITANGGVPADEWHSTNGEPASVQQKILIKSAGEYARATVGEIRDAVEERVGVVLKGSDLESPPALPSHRENVKSAARGS